MHEVLVNCLGGLGLPRKSVVRLTGRPDMTDVYRGRKTTIQQLVSQDSIKTKKNDLKTVANTKVNQPLICRSRSDVFVMQLLQSYKCIYVPSLMSVAAIVCEI